MARRDGGRARESGARFIVRPLFAALVASGLAAPVGVDAATIIVATGGDLGVGSTCTLRQAIDSINGGALVGNCQNTGGPFGTSDTVDLTTQTGTIALVGGNEIQITRPVTINGPGAGVLTVSGENASRVFETPSGSPFSIAINDLGIANGRSAGPGGCIFLAGALILHNSVVSGCTALHDPAFAPYLNGVGGAIAAYSVQLLRSTITGNTAQTAGGGIFAKYAWLDRSLVSNNTVTGQACDLTVLQKYCLPALFGGGGILTGAAQLIHSTVSGNLVNASALSQTTGEPPTLQTFNVGIGGGITQLGKYGYEEFSASAAAKSTIFGPRSTEARAARRASIVSAKAKAKAGGTIGARVKADGYGDYVLAMQSSTLSGNRITGSKLNDGKYVGGGAFGFSEYYNAEIANSTISGNTLDTGGEYLLGGGLFLDSAEISNSTITGNNGAVAIAFKYSGMSGAATAKAKGAKGAAIAAAVRERLAPLRGTRMKAAVNKAASEPIFDSTIVGANPADYDVECQGTCTISGSDNLIQKVGLNTTVPPDTITGQNPQLTPLGNNGGQLAGAPGHGLTLPVPTHLLFIGSPAIDTGANPEGFSYEQRGDGFPRIVGSAADIGATEGAVLGSDIPVPATAPWVVAALSALLGFLGLRRRRRPA